MGGYTDPWSVKMASGLYGRGSVLGIDSKNPNLFLNDVNKYQLTTGDYNATVDDDLFGNFRGEYLEKKYGQTAIIDDGITPGGYNPNPGLKEIDQKQYLMLQMRNPQSSPGQYNPLVNLLTSNHLSDLESGNKFLQDEVEAYKYASSKYTPYITNRNSDGTVDLKIPANSGLAGKVGSGPGAGTLNQPEVNIKGYKLYEGDDSIANYIKNGGGYLAAQKRVLLNTAPDTSTINLDQGFTTTREQQWAIGGYSVAKQQQELREANDYMAAVKGINAERTKYEAAVAAREQALKGRRNVNGAGGGRGVGSAGAASSDEKLLLNRYTLLG